MKEQLNSNNALTRVEVKGLWDRFDIDWKNIDPRVNILVGANGSGKSTLLRILYNLLEGNIVTKLLPIKFDVVSMSFVEEGSITLLNGKRGSVRRINIDVDYINTFDIPTARKSDRSQLLQQLDSVIYQNKESNSFFDYRMQALNYPEMRETVEKNIQNLFDLIDEFFVLTGKKVSIDKNTNKLVFTFQGTNTTIGIEELSAGERQLLLILLKTFLKQDSPYLLLMDEPEISLHIEWQSKLIDSLLRLNPNVQIILTTHSPSVFAAGWGDKLVFMEDITSTCKE